MFSKTKSLTMQRIRHESALESSDHWDTTEKARILQVLNCTSNMVKQRNRQF